MLNRDPKRYYAILGVPSDATPGTIKKAYRRLAKELHPDKNPSTDAKARFQAVNAAYEVLIDPAKRAAYDNIGAAPQTETSKSTEPAPEPVRCSQCGRITVQPRAIVFGYVVSVIVATMRRTIGGVFCTTCARRAAFKASLISGLVGWWGVPWGPIYTLKSIWTNALGGISAAEANERLLWQSAFAFFVADNYQLAYGLARKLRSATNEAIARNAQRMMSRLEQAGYPPSSPPLKDPWRISPFELCRHAAAAAIAPLFLLALIFSNEIEAYREANIAYQPPPPISSKPTFDVSGLTPAPSTEPTCARPVANGALLGGYAQYLDKPGHIIEIKNGSSGDAIIKARNAATGRLVISFLVARNATASFRYLPDGVYRFQYAFGPALRPDCKSFTHIAAAGEFPDLDPMVTEATDREIIHRHLTYTLYAVSSGNVRPQSISAAAFEAE
jgi:DnaJ domain